MDFDWRQLAGSVATVIALVGYVPYFRDIFRGKTKPHAFSWLIWGLLTSIAFAGQLVEYAGPGAWVTGVTAVMCFIIAAVAFVLGEKAITKFDSYCLAFSLAAIPLWVITETPLWSVILISIIDAVGFLPTFRKSYLKPWEETASTFLLGAFKFAIAITALRNYSLVTVLYPLSIVVMNSSFVAMLWYRRQLLNRNAA